MAKRKLPRGAKSQAVRDYIASNGDAGPKAIREALAAKGIVVTPALISNIKYAKKSKRRGKGKRRGRPAATMNGRRGRSASHDKVSLSTLVQAKKLIDQLGGVDKARSAIDALSKLQ